MGYSHLKLFHTVHWTAVLFFHIYNVNNIDWTNTARGGHATYLSISKMPTLAVNNNMDSYQLTIFILISDAETNTKCKDQISQIFKY